MIGRNLRKHTGQLSGAGDFFILESNDHVAVLDACLFRGRTFQNLFHSDPTDFPQTILTEIISRDLLSLDAEIAAIPVEEHRESMSLALRTRRRCLGLTGDE